MKRVKKLNGWQRVGYAVVGFGMIGLIILGIWAYNNVSSSIHFDLWNSKNIQPYLTGNVAVDQNIVSNAGWSNFMSEFVIAMMIAGAILIPAQGCRFIYRAAKGI